MLAESVHYSMKYGELYGRVGAAMAQSLTAPKRVLVVDDEPKFCQVVAEFLRRRGYEAVTAESGTQAILRLERFTPDVVLLDIRMPGLSGLEVIKLLRARFLAPRIIVISAADPDQTGREAIQLGAQAFMCKPIDFTQLEQVISGVFPSTPQASPS